MKKISYIFITALLLINLKAAGQFYNGHQMTFGKNRVQYNNFYWSYYKFDHYDIYFNQDGEPVARFTGETANKHILELEEKLNHTLQKHLTFLVYNKFSDFKQSNVGLVTGKEEYNIGGVTKIRNNKISLYFQGNHNNYIRQMRESIAEVMITEMLYGNKITESLTNSGIINLPEWYINGLASYLAEDWSIDIENRVKDGILSGRYAKFSRLEGTEAVFAGHSFWKYINDYYGPTVISDIIYTTRISKGVNSAIYSVLGQSFKDINKQWLQYYQDYFSSGKQTFEENSDKKIISPKRNSIIYYQAKQNPGGEKIAYVSNEMGQYKIWIYDTHTEKSEKILKHGHRIKQINDYTYPVLEWHPSGKILTIITEREGGLKLIHYIADEDKFAERNLLYFDKILDFDYSSDGTSLVFSAVKDSKTDIYIYDIASATHKQLTNDIADDLNPSFIKNTKLILFSSNRISDSLLTSRGYSDQFDLYTVDYTNKTPQIKRLTTTNYANETKPFPASNNEYFYLNDKNGIRNLYNGRYDSTIRFIDTAIHYRYFLNEKPLSNLSRNIIEHNFNPLMQKYYYISFNNGHTNIYNHEFESKAYSELTKTPFREELNKKIHKSDSLAFAIEKIQIGKDSITIQSKEDNYVDINHYVFEIERPYFKYKYDSISGDTIKPKTSFPKIQVYQRTFFTDQIISQVDFSFLNSTYQAFTGGAVYFNPGFNALLKIGAVDLLEDYKIIAGVRFSADFYSNEYLVSLENLKKKLDEQFVYHRQSFQNTTDDFITKTLTNEGMYNRTLPFDQIRAVKGSVIFRYDKVIWLSTDRNSLQLPDNHMLRAGLKLDYIFDNTISRGTNLYEGTRYKIFGEYYQQVNKNYTNLFVLGADFRNYIRVHRELILATRFAASASFGKSKLIYYLGGVDNWTNFSQKTPTFIPLDEIKIDENQEYTYQAVATNMRGFPQNIRNGSNFALINAELRMPVVKYFSNYPVNSSFWSNLQLIGFFDVGSAWSGLSPYSDENAYNKEVIPRGTYTITLDKELDPIVAGYGFGFRMMLFGYFTRFDWAWGIENQQITPRIFYFSLSLDF